MLLKEFCTTNVLFCPRETTVLEAARIMRQNHIGDIVVVDDARDDCTPVGMVTDRDIVVRVLGNDLDPRRTTVGEIMRMPLVTASEQEDSSVAIVRMRTHGVRRMPITGNRGALTGIVTLDDLLRGLRLEVDALIDIVVNEQDQERRRVR